MITYVRTYRKSISVIKDTIKGRDMEVRHIDEEAEKYAACKVLRAEGKGNIATFKDKTWCYRAWGFAFAYKERPWSSFGLKVRSERA